MTHENYAKTHSNRYTLWCPPIIYDASDHPDQCRTWSTVAFCIPPPTPPGAVGRQGGCRAAPTLWCPPTISDVSSLPRGTKQPKCQYQLM